MSTFVDRLTDSPAADQTVADGAPVESGSNDSPLCHDILEHALVACLAAFAEVAGASGHAERAFRLRDAVDVLRFGRVPDPPSLSLQLRQVSDLAASLSLNNRVVKSAAEPKRSPLSARELEVAGLVAQGLTNRQIASQLVISERTADTHVQNILNKLGAASRAQVAIWFMDYALRISSHS